MVMPGKEKERFAMGFGCGFFYLGVGGYISMGDITCEGLPCMHCLQGAAPRSPAPSCSCLTPGQARGSTVSLS